MNRTGSSNTPGGYDPVENLRHRLKAVRAAEGGFVAECPACMGKHASLHVTRLSDGTAWLRCEAGCSPIHICAKLGLPIHALFPGGDEAKSDAEPISNTPIVIAAAFLQSRGWARVRWACGGGGADHPMAIEPTRLRHWREEFYLFKDCAYWLLPLEELKAKLVPWMGQRQVFTADLKCKPLRATRALIGDVVDQLRAHCQAPCDSMPAWIDHHVDRPHPDDVLAFRNGLLGIETWLADPAEMPQAPTHSWFSTSVLPRDYDPEATCPKCLKFFHDTLASQDQVNLLQEWFGYCLTHRTDYQKMLWLHGVAGAGKGTTAKLMKELVGQANAVSFGLFDLTERFTLSSFVGKTLAISGDAHLGQSSDAQWVIEQVLTIAGEDDKNIDRKNRDLLPSVRLKTRLVLLVNGFPHLPDAGIALRRRSVVLSFRRSFQDSAKVNLFEELRTEMAGLTNWAMKGLQRLIARGKFPETETSTELLDRLGRMSSPLRSFMEDCFVIDEHPLKKDQKASRVLKRQAFRVWQEWAKVNGHRPMANNTFCEKLYDSDPRIQGRRLGANGDRVQIIEGVAFTPEAGKLFPDLNLPNSTSEAEENVLAHREDAEKKPKEALCASVSH